MATGSPRRAVQLTADPQRPFQPVHAPPGARGIGRLFVDSYLQSFGGEMA
ncbi:MAG TPA: hypothetical protein VGH77_05870 [Streptosporangiaceae bacterium]